MTPKKQPLRQCTGCGEMRPKRELVRVVKTPEGNVMLDRSGKLNGRGAYICRDAQCLKKAAKAVGEKSIAMIKSKELLPLTGYIHGGCSPIGMKKQFRTVIDSSAENFETIIFSAGKIGYQVEVSILDLQKIVRVESAEIVVNE